MFFKYGACYSNASISSLICRLLRMVQYQLCHPTNIFLLLHHHILLMVQLYLYCISWCNPNSWYIKPPLCLFRVVRAVYSPASTNISILLNLLYCLCLTLKLVFITLVIRVNHHRCYLNRRNLNTLFKIYHTIFD